MSQLTKNEMEALVAVAKHNPEFSLQQAFRFGVAAAMGDAAHKATKRAADLLDFDAESLKEAHAPYGQWDGEEEAKADYDERKRIAKALRGLA